jgi:hypothetical protein
VLRKIGPLVFLAAVMLLAFWKVLFHPEFTLLTGGDMCSQTFPWFNIAAYWLKKGSLLLWDPYVYSGKANLGELQPGVLYPLNWLFMLLPASGGGINLEGLQALLILNYFLAGGFTYLLARSFAITSWGAAASGVAFALGGYTIQVHGFVNIFSGFVWMPLVLLLFRRALLEKTSRARLRWSLWCGACLGLSFLAGHHVPPVHAGLLLFFYTLFTLFRDWKQSRWSIRIAPLLALGGVALVAALSTAVQWLPSIEWARQVYRWIGEGDPIRWGERIPYSVLGNTGNLMPEDAVSLLLPYAGSGANMYVGSTVVFLALVALLFVRNRETYFFGGALFLYFFLSWGTFSVLHGWVNTFIPGVWFAREVFHYLVPFQLCLALLVGWGLDYLVEAYTASPDRSFRIFLRRAGWGMAFLVVSCGVLIAANPSLPLSHRYIRGLAGLAAYVTLLGFLLFLLHTGRVRPAVFRYLIIIVLVVDLASEVSAGIRTKNRPRGEPNPSIQSYWRIPPAAEFLRSQRDREYFRVEDPEQIFPPNFGDAWRLESAMGHGATGLVRYLDFRGTDWGPASNASALLSLRYFASRTPVPWMEKVFEGPDAIYRNPRALPKTFLASSYRSFASDQEILRWVRSPAMSVQETVLLRKGELHRLASFRSGIVDEDDEIEAHILSHRTAAEKKAEGLTDEEAHRKLTILQPPWGWSAGDEVEISFRPRTPGMPCFAVVSFYPAGLASSPIKLRLKGPESEVDLAADLVGNPATGDLQHVAVDLGRLDAVEYRLSFIKTADCAANVDSLRIARSPSNAVPAGRVSIRSFLPNRLTLHAELNRPAFVVLSEVFYPGWEAVVDGRPAPLLRGNYILRAIPVPAGTHAIEVRFRSGTFQWGLVVSLLTLAGMAFVLVRGRSKSDGQDRNSR